MLGCAHVPFSVCQELSRPCTLADVCAKVRAEPSLALGCTKELGGGRAQQSTPLAAFPRKPVISAGISPLGHGRNAICCSGFVSIIPCRRCLLPERSAAQSCSLPSRGRDGDSGIPGGGENRKGVSVPPEPGWRWGSSSLIPWPALRSPAALLAAGSRRCRAQHRR